MAIGHHHEEHDREHAHGIVATEAASVREPFGVAQVICIAIGIFFVVIGAIGLARAGMDQMTEPSVEVGGLGMTPLLALTHLIIGALALAGASGRSAARGVSMFLGPLLVAAGIIALIEEIGSLGWTEMNGFAYLLTGAGAILGAVVTPIAVVADRRIVA